jgi:hypothetical protein
MKMMHFLVSVTIVALLAFGTAQATVITFDGLSQNNGSAFTGPYVEGGYTVIASDLVFEDNLFGAPPPSLVVRPSLVVLPAPELAFGTVEVSFGGLPFILENFDLFRESLVLNPVIEFPSADYAVTGRLGGSTIFTFNGSVADGPGFTTINGAPGAIDVLDFTLTAEGASVNLDNIVVDAAPVAPPAVPEPVSLLLAAISLGGLALVFTERRSADSVPPRCRV